MKWRWGKKLRGEAGESIRTLRNRFVGAPLALVLIALVSGTVVRAEEPRWDSALNNDYYKISFDTRLRIEVADIDGFRTSQAWTARSRFGIGSKPWMGLSGFAEGSATVTPSRSAYYDGAGDNNERRSTVADPQGVRLNRLFLRYQNDDVLGLEATAGRQRIIFDDARFIGNVGWRQTEQTLDAGYGSTDLGIEGFRARYAYLWHVNRIWLDQGKNNTRDWDSRSHAVNVSYERFAFLKVSAFAYLFDFKNDSRANSSNSFGVRIDGTHTFGEVWELAYAGSFAHQKDAANNPVDYDVIYAWISGDFGHKEYLGIGAGLEVFGSDDGNAGFVTPLATAHKFNGFADVFLDNGGANGLRDMFLSISPVLPWSLDGKLIYHRFWSDEQRRHLGDEVDAVLSRKFGKYVTALAKGAWFEGQSGSGRSDRWRAIFEVSLQY